MHPSWVIIAKWSLPQVKAIATWFIKVYAIRTGMWSTTASGHRVALIIIVEVDTIRTRCQQNGEMSLGTHGEILVLARCAEKMWKAHHGRSVRGHDFTLNYGDVFWIEWSKKHCHDCGWKRAQSSSIYSTTLLPVGSCFSSLSLQSWPHLEQPVGHRKNAHLRSWAMQKRSALAHT